MTQYQEFRDIAQALGVDAVALVPGANFTRTFHTNFHTSERPLVVFIPLEGNPAAIVPNLELASFAKIGFDGAVYDWRDQDGYQGAFDALAKNFPMRSVAVEGQGMRVFVSQALEKAYGTLDIQDGESAISGLRLCKTDSEISAMREAILISERALGDLLDDVHEGITEKALEARLIAHLFRHGAHGMAFDPIVAAGANSAMPHAHAGNYALQKGDALLIDFGAIYDGLHADITRTFFLGHASDEAASVYQTVLAANEAGLQATRAGVTAHDVDDAVISVLEASPFKDRIRTKTGHGLGRQVHEEPYIMRGNHQKLEAGMVYTNEPGLYEVGNFGVRIEDDVLVTDTGYRLLTSFSKELTIIGC